jgi:integrase
MPRPRNQVPTYRLHKQSGQAIVTISSGSTRRDVLLGRYGTPESRTEYQRVLAEINASGSAAVAIRTSGADVTVNEVILAFMNWAGGYYRGPDGSATNEIAQLSRALSPLKELYGYVPAREFGPRALAAVQQRMVESGLCRTLVNKRVDRVKRVFKWAASEELVPVTVYQSLRTLAGLRRGRTEARESDPVKPVDPAHVAATLPHLNRHIRAMVELQRLTGMRPGEVCKLTIGEVERSEELWLYRPAHHKTAHHGKDRVIPFGPRARALIIAFLIGDHPPPEGFSHIDLMDPTARLVAADAYQEADRGHDTMLRRDTAHPVVFVAGCVVDPVSPLFSPWEAREERYRTMRTNRKSKVPPSQKNRRAQQPKCRPQARFTPESYAHAVGATAKKVGVQHWHPNQLRHLFATEVRKAHGLEAAQVLLGHSRADITQVYAERDLALASKVAIEVG